MLRWGDIGAKWGVNRSVAQIHALLHIAHEPMTAEDIADTLGLARSHVSTGQSMIVRLTAGFASLMQGLGFAHAARTLRLLVVSAAPRTFIPEPVLA